jgi:hypothetical protein
VSSTMNAGAGTASGLEVALEISTYAPFDGFFGAPFVDCDEVRTAPVMHRYVHGGFEGTDTRFLFCFPPRDRFRGRLLQPLGGGNAGDEGVNYNPHGAMITGGIEMIFRLGGYAVESNMGHIGDVPDPTAGDDPTIYGWRAAAESARFSKFLAAQILGRAPAHSYVYGGSGGARRSPLCLAYAPDVWDGAVPFMGDANDGDHGDFARIRHSAGNFATMFNVRRVLGDKIDDVLDATWPGGSGDPFATLDTHQREELAALYRLGYPRGAEFVITQPMGQIWMWASLAERLEREDPYFERFWTEPGHVGNDRPDLVQGDLIDTTLAVTRVLTTQEIFDDPEFSTPELFPMFAVVRGVMDGTGRSRSLATVVQIEGVGAGDRLGACLRLTSGEATGRKLYCINTAGDYFFCDGIDDASNLRFTGVQAGDQVHIDNHSILAFCYYARHHCPDSPEYDFLRVDGRAVYEQYELPEMSPFMGTRHTGRFAGRMIWVHHTHDASLWPSQGIGMRDNVRREVGQDEGRQHFRLRWLENAEHIPPALAASPARRANTTWLVDYLPMVEQTLMDLIAWVEEGVEPAETHFEYDDGRVRLPPTAAARGGIQPVVTVEANGGTRADVAVGEDVRLRARSEVPPGAGFLVGLRWDFDGSGAYPVHHDLDGTLTELDLSTTHRFDQPGTYFVTAMVESHRDGDAASDTRRIANVSSARVVVT